MRSRANGSLRNSFLPWLKTNLSSTVIRSASATSGLGHTAISDPVVRKSAWRDPRAPAARFPSLQTTVCVTTRPDRAFLDDYNKNQNRASILLGSIVRTAKEELEIEHLEHLLGSHARHRR